MGVEIQRPSVVQDPQSIQKLHTQFVTDPASLTPGKFTTIQHMLSADVADKYRAEHKPTMTPETYNQLMKLKHELYEPIMDNLSNIRDNATDLIKESGADEVIDLAAGEALIAPRIARIKTGMKYYAVDASNDTIDIARPMLMELHDSGKLAEAEYSQHNLTDGFPEVIPGVEPGKTRVAVSIWGASYLPAPELVKLVSKSFNNGCRAFINVGVNPKYFDVPKILDAMVASAMKRSSEEIALLSPIIKSAKPGGAGRGFMEKFGQMLTHGTPIRTEEETRFYLEQAGSVIDSGFFDMTSGRSFYHIVVPK